MISVEIKRPLNTGELKFPCLLEGGNGRMVVLATGYDYNTCRIHCTVLYSLVERYKTGDIHTVRVDEFKRFVGELKLRQL